MKDNMEKTLILSGGDHLYLQELTQNQKVKKSSVKMCQLNVVVCSFVAIMIVAVMPVANCSQLVAASDDKRDHQYQKQFEVANVSSSIILRRLERGILRNVSDNLYNKQISPYGSPPILYKHEPQQFYFNDNSTSLKYSSSTISTDLVSFNLVEGLRDNLCDFCQCDNQKFVTIMCDYRQNSKLSNIFDSKYSIPSATKSLIIKLGPKTKFFLLNGFFQQNKVNSIIINGTNSIEQVEIGKGAFKSIGGGYPDICINDIFAVIVRDEVANGSMRFTVRNSNELLLYSNAFADTEINAVFSSIKDLRIYEKAFSAGKIFVENSYLGDIFRFEASLNEIRFYNCTIDTINAGAFDVNSISSIIFESCRIGAIKARAFTDKLLSNHLSIKNGIIGYIESEAIYGSGITELILAKNTIDKIHRNAIQATAVNVTIINNSIKNLDNQWLHIKQWSYVFLENNRFGIFGSLKLEEQARPSLCKFHNNSITSPLSGSLNFSECQMHGVSVNIDCVCSSKWLNTYTDHDFRSEIYCRIDNRLSSCFGTSNLNYLKYMNEVCDETKTQLHCPGNQTLEKVNGNFYTREELAQNDPLDIKLILKGIGCVLAIIIILVIIICLVIRIYKRRIRVEDTFNHLHEFSPTDRNVINQTLQLMEKKYKEIYKPVNEKVDLMFQNNLSDKKCVKTISQIVSLMGKVNSPPEDFNAFNQILTQHLQPPLPNAPYPDSIYTEPRLDYQQDTTYSGSIVLIPNVPYNNSAIQNTVITSPTEHIYAEPSCAQQPLLRNEYASPADRNTDPMDLYTEPISERALPNPNPGGHLDSSHSYSTPTPSHLRRGNQMNSRDPLPDVLEAQHETSATSPRNRQDIQLSTFLPKPLSQSVVQKERPNVPTYTSPYNHRLHFRQPNTVENLNENWNQSNLIRPSTDSGSNHSGGTNETVPIDDIIEYVDA